ncbi:zinc-binding alcohol dehydrogenase family protein [Weissella cibaria]|uniref:zinc-binding alcohol dehydrogenase family protein n=1 Tax=Weissella cibaria TaxID=137591 RepID=UPI00223B6DF1|nr:zinc-binding alcohol dehydrogenase family protein [Weissella cibaria]MCS9988230.1 zinc-binding alcohol dehydrogenase family protein [Weissella cibaria]
MSEFMQAVVTTSNEAQPLEVMTIPAPVVSDEDVLVRVKAVAVNPVDGKQRQAAVANKSSHVLGFDATGEVVAVGSKVTDFKLGDTVFYAGQLGRLGANAELQAVNAALVAKAPTTLSHAEAAALPLTFLTAYELLVDKFGLTVAENSAKGQTILIINGAGGVGSIMIQLAKWMGMTVVATASRQETSDWVTKLGADHVVNHRRDYVADMHSLGFDLVPYIAILHAPEAHFEQAAALVGPFGHIGAIVESVEPLPVGLIKNKAASLDWEFMFAKANYGVNMATQGRALALAATLADQGVLRTTLTETMTGMTAETILAAQEKVAAGKVNGKLAIEF